MQKSCISNKGVNELLDINKKSDCMGCSACVSVCSKGAVKLVPDEEGFCYPTINESLCIGCGMCERVCPLRTSGESNTIKQVVSAYNKDETTRMNSSSGGVFFNIATSVIKQGGVVFGAVFDEKFNVLHTFAENKEGIKKICKSKYMQSEIGSSFIQAKNFLEAGRIVLFSGTPCQIAGLKSYLKKDYDNLFTQDIICHGVPSKAVWQEYLKQVNKNNKKIKSVNFRSKKSGWKSYGLEIEYSDNSNYYCEFTKNDYSKAFLKNLCLRPSCYECKFKKMQPYSDITLADYWGANFINPELDDDKGLSLVFINSEKGKQLLDKEAEKLFIQEADLEKALLYNPSLIKPAEKHKNRDKFMREFRTKPFNELVLKYGKEKKPPIIVTYYRRGKAKLKRMLFK